MGNDVCVFRVPNNLVIKVVRVSSSSDMGNMSDKSSQHSAHGGLNTPMPLLSLNGSSVSIAHALVSSPSPPPQVPTPTPTAMIPAGAAVVTPAPVAELINSRDLDFHVITSQLIDAPDGFRFWGMQKEFNLKSNASHQRYFVVIAGIVKIFQWSIPSSPFGNDLKGYVVAFK
jgi:hypothetical protein